MPTLEDHLIGGYVADGRDKASLDRRLARALYVRDLVHTVYGADRRYGFTLADAVTRDHLVAAEGHLDQIPRNVGAFPALPTQGERQ